MKEKQNGQHIDQRKESLYVCVSFPVISDSGIKMKGKKCARGGINKVIQSPSAELNHSRNLKIMSQLKGGDKEVILEKSNYTPKKGHKVKQYPCV